jgi:tetratricopeptide (TPR) repeat protein
MEKAVALYELERYHEAVICLVKAIKFNPVNTQYQFELVENLLKLKNYDAVEKALRFLLTQVIYPNDVARMYRRFGFYYTETQKYDVALACYVWSIRFEASDNAINELLYIQSLCTGNGDPKYLANAIPKITDPKMTMDNLHSERLLLFFFDARKDFILSGATPELEKAAKLYQSMGLIRDDASQPEQRNSTPKAEFKEVKPKPFTDFLNKYKK